MRCHRDTENSRKPIDWIPDLVFFLLSLMVGAEDESRLQEFLQKSSFFINRFEARGGLKGGHK